jgi:hypothetical protein
MQTSAVYGGSYNLREESIEHVFASGNGGTFITTTWGSNTGLIEMYYGANTSSFNGYLATIGADTVAALYRNYYGKSTLATNLAGTTCSSMMTQMLLTRKYQFLSQFYSLNSASYNTMYTSVQGMPHLLSLRASQTYYQVAMMFLSQHGLFLIWVVAILQEYGEVSATVILMRYWQVWVALA